VSKLRGAVQAQYNEVKPVQVVTENHKAKRLIRISSKFTSALSVFVANAVLIVLIHPLSIFSYLYFFLLSLLCYKILVGDGKLEPIYLYPFYSFLIVIMYLLQYWGYPEYFGFSGGLGIGTDDARFYSMVAASLPSDFPVRVDWIYPYGQLLRAVTWWYQVKHPLDILFFNAIPLVLIPSLTSGVAATLTDQEAIRKTSYRLVALCPFLLSNSLILIRDGWIAMAFIGAILYFLEGKYARMALLVALAFYLRIASALVLLFVLIAFAMIELIHKRGISRLTYSVGILVGIGVTAFLFYPSVDRYLEAKGVYNNIAFRENYLSFMELSVQASSSGDSVALWIYHQSPWIRLPLGFVYYFMAPFFVPNFIGKGVLAPRGLLTNLFAILSVFYLKCFIQAVFKAWHDDSIKWRVIILTYLVSVLMLSQVSIQLRHKVMLLPLFYVLVAYGHHNQTKWGRTTGTITAYVSATVQLGRSLLRVF